MFSQSLHIELGFDGNISMMQVLSALASIKGELPESAENPVVSRQTGSDTGLLYLSFFGKFMSREQITEYLSREVQTKLQTLDGVAEAQLMGGRSFSMRVWIDQNRLAGYGLVVDDAIVMVENVSRHIEAGLPPAEAARVGAREIALPIISMTLTLAAVYAPIGFIGGLTGTLFREFAFTLAAAVVISGVVALVLSPMMCSRVLRPESGRGLEAFSERLFGGLQEFYERRLRNSLKYRPSVLILVVAVLSAIPYLWLTSKSKLAPVEDKGSLIFTGSAPNRARSKPYWPFFRSRLLPWLCFLQTRP